MPETNETAAPVLDQECYQYMIHFTLMEAAQRPAPLLECAKAVADSDWFKLLVRKAHAPDAFKAYVHQRLDEAGVPTHPDGPHSAVGCRVGDRLDILIRERDEARAALLPFVNACAKAEDSAAQRARVGMGTMGDGASPGWGVNFGHLKEARRVYTGGILKPPSDAIGACPRCGDFGVCGCF
jgi:hypothetical protein